MSGQLVVGNSRQSEWDARYTCLLAAKRQRVPATPHEAQPVKLPREQAPDRGYNILTNRFNQDDACVRILAKAITLLPKHQAAALVLCQIAYFAHEATVRNRFTYRRDRKTRTALWIGDLWWVAADKRQLAKRTGLTLTQVKRALKLLFDRGMLTRYVGKDAPTNGAFVRLADSTASLVESSGVGVKLYVNLLHACKNKIVPAVILTNFCFWMGRSKTDERCRASWYTPDGRPWISKSYRQIRRELGYTHKQVRWAVEWLVAQQLVVVKQQVGKAGTKRANLYSVEPETVLARLSGQPIVTWWSDNQLADPS